MIVLDILGLGVPEMIVVLIAILLLIDPKNLVYVKPIVKAAYKAWLSYRIEVEKAQNEMEGVKQSVMEPIISAKREAETEISKAAGEKRSLAESIEKDLKEARSEIEDARKEVRGKAKENAGAPKKNPRKKKPGGEEASSQDKTQDRASSGEGSG